MCLTVCFWVNAGTLVVCKQRSLVNITVTKVDVWIVFNSKLVLPLLSLGCKHNQLNDLQNLTVVRQMHRGCVVKVSWLWSNRSCTQVCRFASKNLWSYPGHGCHNSVSRLLPPGSPPPETDCVTVTLFIVLHIVFCLPQWRYTRQCNPSADRICFCTGALGHLHMRESSFCSTSSSFCFRVSLVSVKDQLLPLY